MTDPNLFQLPVNIETPRNDKNRVATIRAGYAREKEASEAGVRATKRGEIPFAYEELTYEWLVRSPSNFVISLMLICG
jgi:hypothetical protein